MADVYTGLWVTQQQAEILQWPASSMPGTQGNMAPSTHISSYLGIRGCHGKRSGALEAPDLREFSSSIALLLCD